MRWVQMKTEMTAVSRELLMAIMDKKQIERMAKPAPICGRSATEMGKH